MLSENYGWHAEGHPDDKRVQASVYSDTSIVLPTLVNGVKHVSKFFSSRVCIILRSFSNSCGCREIVESDQSNTSSAELLTIIAAIRKVGATPYLCTRK